ncbi:DNA topoisomerase IB [Arachidicoccus terrestris]|uniref:DNA topoisomerase IB n=1 Tax=Arachidicoccus terrestris TaxID=2875539 RepID=UPI001CC59BE3|nr:DNA topoisomerase IB [Arachidicoccus terrestris]UAY53972.1 DNA topoisomerase IB [Arachidicoccus terrestris]
MPDQHFDSRPEALLEQAHLRYIDRYSNGIFRIKKGNAFGYVDHKGNDISDDRTLDRIKALIIPPAWEQVWICPYSNGHLQATGIDAAGRKQYRYHNKWLELRNQTKFDNLMDFGRELPSLRRQLKKDLKLTVLDKEKVTAIAITLMDNVFMRVGNSNYEHKYGSYGLTTLKNRHVSIRGKDCFFRFRGKKGVQQKLSLNSKVLAQLLKTIKEIPGQTLFQYFDEQGQIRQLGSGDINDYLKCYMGKDFTCKDFRTWSGTVLALTYMLESYNNEQHNASHAETVAILDKVASALGNTRSVTKKYYVHLGLLEAFENSSLFQFVANLRSCRPGALHKKGEKELLKFLQHCRRSSKKHLQSGKLKG